MAMKSSLEDDDLVTTEFDSAYSGVLRLCPKQQCKVSLMYPQAYIKQM